MKLLKTFEERDIKEMEKKVNDFAKEHRGLVGPITPVCVSDGNVRHYGYIWYEAGEDDGWMDLSDWKYFEDSQKYWTKGKDDGIEKSIAPKKGGGFYFLQKDGEKKLWGDVIELDEKKKRVKVKMRE